MKVYNNLLVYLEKFAFLSQCTQPLPPRQVSAVMLVGITLINMHFIQFVKKKKLVNLTRPLVTLLVYEEIQASNYKIWYFIVLETMRKLTTKSSAALPFPKFINSSKY